jgi:hypothetical protein
MPRFTIWGDGVEERDAVERTAASASKAAEAYCAARDRATLECEPERVVFVRRAGSCRTSVFQVAVRATWEYTAREAK